MYLVNSLYKRYSSIKNKNYDRKTKNSKSDEQRLSRCYVWFIHWYCRKTISRWKKGGYFTIKQLNNGNATITKRVGCFSKEKTEKYKFLSFQENPDRLMKYIKHGHLTSYESRNPEAEVFISTLRNEKWGYWGGAVLIIKQFIFSFSGLPELLDEAFVCFLGIKSGLMTKCQFGIIKKRRLDNPYLEVLNTVLIKKKK